jgi:anaerobic magnesium-protoporphyrin IX monomethyl ester cyclase
MTDILFANAYFYPMDAKQWKFRQPYPPLATILAAAIVRSEGYTVSLFDTNLRTSPEEISATLEKHKPKYFIIYDDGFNYLSKMCLTVMREAAFQMIIEAKKSGCKIIVSSSDATDHIEKYFTAGADVIMQGEADATVKDVLDALEKNRDLGSIAGISFQKDGRVQSTSSRTVIKELDALPFPAWDLVEIEKYRTIWIRHHGYFSLNIATTRGCPFKCNWCAKPIYGNRYNSRSPGHVVSEIEHLLKQFKPDHFWMCDDIFGLKPGWIQHFNKVVYEKRLKFKYKIQSRADLLLESDTIQALAESGAETVWIGAESGSQKILDAMDKGTTIDQISEARKLLKQHHIRVAFFLQFGYLGETREDIDKTIDMLLELMPDEIGISVSYPLPGTKFYEKVKYQLKEKQNWTDSDDLAMMFQSTFNSRYYKNLHRYVHNLYRRQLGIQRLRGIFKSPLSFSKSDIKTLVGIFYYGMKAIIFKSKLPEINYVKPSFN